MTQTPFNNPIFSLEKANDVFKDISPKFEAVVTRFAVALSVDVNGVLTLVGSGTYLRIDGSIFVLTNYHVAISGDRGDLLHRPYTGKTWMHFDEKYRETKDFFFVNDNGVDLALIQVDAEEWDGTQHNAAAIGLDQINKFDGPDGEIYGFLGYSEQRNIGIYRSDKLKSDVSLSMLKPLREYDLIRKEIHVSFEHQPELATNYWTDTKLPIPHGFSGSALWDTKAGACILARKSWRALEMRVAGVVTYWDKPSKGIIAIRSYLLRNFIDSYTTHSKRDEI